MFIPTLGPKIDPVPLSKAERVYAMALQRVLWNMGHRCADLGAASELFESCLDYTNKHRNPVGDAQRQYWLREHWAHMAAREAAANIYRFKEDMRAAGDNLEHCPSLMSTADLEQKEAATELFDKYFSDWLTLRHTGQHHGKFYGTPARVAEHVIDGQGFLINEIRGHALVTTYMKKRIVVEFTADTILKLQEVRDLYWGVFVPTTP